MEKSLYIIPSEGYLANVWQKIIENLSHQEIAWNVDCLDCLHETELKPGLHSSDELLAELKDNTYVFFARMISWVLGKEGIKKILTKDDIRASDCESIVLCTDIMHFEIFSKDPSLLLKLSASFLEKEIEKLEWIDDDQCGRSEFIVF